MKNVLLLVGARPNFIKIAPLYTALTQQGAKPFIVHTGQHYDDQLSAIFFRELGIPAPDVNLQIGSGERIEQTHRMISALLPLLGERKPDGIVVVGDVTSSAAGAMAGVAAGIPVLHVEAGLRSFNLHMPEEVNRIIADHYADVLFISEAAAKCNLQKEGIQHRVKGGDPESGVIGNVMIDTLRRVEVQLDIPETLSRYGVEDKSYGVLTLHRPENVDDRDILESLCHILNKVAERLPLLFPVHPRTRGKIQELSFALHERIRLLDPLGYRDMLALTKSARCVLTDSGGLQEETTALGVPCLTLRTETERPATVDIGTSEIMLAMPKDYQGERTILDVHEQMILGEVDRILRGEWKKGEIPPYWDGHTAERIAEAIVRL